MPLPKYGQTWSSSYIKKTINYETIYLNDNYLIQSQTYDIWISCLLLNWKCSNFEVADIARSDNDVKVSVRPDNTSQYAYSLAQLIYLITDKSYFFPRFWYKILAPDTASFECNKCSNISRTVSNIRFEIKIKISFTSWQFFGKIKRFKFYFAICHHLKICETKALMKGHGSRVTEKRLQENTIFMAVLSCWKCIQILLEICIHISFVTRYPFWHKY